MAILAIPNVSEGRDPLLVRRIGGASVLDIHSDPDHNRSVLTYGGAPDFVVEECVAMTERAVAELDLRTHVGAHPRFGVVDVVPFVPYSSDESVAARAAAAVARRITADLTVPVHFYDRAAADERSLPALRRWLRTGESDAHPTAGVVCIGVRPPLIAFNVNLRGSIAHARALARAVRSPYVRALGFELPSQGLVQVSMNLIAPMSAGPYAAYAAVAAVAGNDIVDCEVVGLVPEAVLSELEGVPLRRAARSVESALGS